MGGEEGYEYQDALPAGPARGRGAGLNPGNRFEAVRLHVLGEALDEAAATAQQEGPARMATHLFADRSRTILNRVDSEDMPFHWTLNAYRGCEHGCRCCCILPPCSRAHEAEKPH